MRWLALLSVLALGLAASGCATVGTFQSADTLGKGGRQFGLEPSVWWPKTGNETPLPNVGMTARWGVNDHYDMGFRLGTSGLELLTKVGIVQGAHPITLAVAPSFGGLYAPYKGTTAGVLAGQVPLLLGVNLARHELVVAPKFQVWHMLGGEERETAINAGGSLGFAIRLGKRVELIPEVAAVVPLKSWQWDGEPVALVQPGQGVMLDGGMAILFGRYKKKKGK